MKRIWVAWLAVPLVIIASVFAVLFGPFLAVVTRGIMCNYSLGEGFDLFIDFAAYVLPTGVILGVAGGLIGGGIALARQTDKRARFIIALGSLSVAAGLLYGCGVGGISLIADC